MIVCCWRRRAPMVAFFVLVMIAGGVAFTQLNIEAYPAPSPPLVDIVTQNPGQSAEEIERYITIPIEIGVATAPYLSAMRSISLFGLSDVKLQFTYDLTYEEAEQKVQSAEPVAHTAEPGAADHLALEPDRRDLPL